MKLLILTCLLAVSWAAPLARPDDDDDDDKGKGPDSRSGYYVTSGGVPHSVLSGYQPVSYAAHGPVSFAPGSQVFHSVHPSGVEYTSAAHFGAVGVAKYESGEVGSVAVHGPPIAYTSGASFVPSGQVSYSVKKDAVPTVTTYNAAQYHAVVPGQATQFVAAAPTFSVDHAAPVQYHAAAEVAPAPVQYYAQAAAAAINVAPAFATVQDHTVQRAAVAAVPTVITYQSEHTVKLSSKEIDVPVQQTYVYRPVEQRTNYKTENYVSGSTTTIHKPNLSAPAIAPPQIFKTKTQYAAPEVTLRHSEVTVQENSPNYVDAPYDAGVVVEQAAPEIKQVDVLTPVEVPHPVAVPTPYHVKVAQPVKVKSSISPVVNVDVHSVQTENVVTPVEYTAHHHVATAPVVTQTFPIATSQLYAQAPEAVVYGAAVPFEQAATYSARHAVTGDGGQAVTGYQAFYGAAVPFEQVATYSARQAKTGNGGQAVTGNGGQAVTGNGGQAVTGNGGVYGAAVPFEQAETYSARQAKTGNGGQAVTGNGGQAVTGNGGQAVTGNGGVYGAAVPFEQAETYSARQAKTGNGGQAVTGNGGQAVTGNGGQAKTGNGGLYGAAVPFEQAATSRAGKAVTFFSEASEVSNTGFVSGAEAIKPVTDRSTFRVQW